MKAILPTKALLSGYASYFTPLLLLLALDTLGQAPTIISRQPAANSITATGNTPVVVGFSAATPAAANVRVVGNRYAGLRLGPPVVSGSTTSLTPVPPFGPGERVSVSIPSTGAGATPKVYEFMAAPAAAAATFGPAQVLAVGIYPTALAPADLDGDGDLDLAVANAGTGGSSATGKVFIYLNNGQGVFAANGTQIPAKLTQDIMTADMDLDGDLDFVFTNFGPPVVEVSFNAGNATLVGGIIGGTGGFDTVTCADLNGDGYPDYASTGGQNQLTIGLRALSSPNGFTTTTTTFVTNDIGRSSFIDLDGDGDLDILTPSTGSAQVLYVHLNDSNGQFTPGPSRALATYAGELLTGDFDNDGLADLLVYTGLPAMLNFYRNLGGGTFAAPVTTSSPQFLHTIAADFNGDGNVDIAGGVPSNRMQVLLGNGTGQLRPGAVITATGPVSKLYAADLNGDGRLDLAAPVISLNTVNIFFNQPAILGTAAAASLPRVEIYPNPVTAGLLHLRVPLSAGQAGEPCLAELRNTLGQLVRHVPLQVTGQDLTATIEVSGISPGIYSLRVTAGLVSASYRIAIE